LARVVASAALVLLVASCSVDAKSIDAAISESALDAFNDDAADEANETGDPDASAVEQSGDNENSPRGSRTLATAGIDATLTRDDGVCIDSDDGDIGDDRFTYTVAYQVVDGTLGAPCFGEPDELLEASWTMLAEITPPDQLRDLAIFAGFASPGDTLAFVTTADAGLGSLYEMSINLDTARNDAVELSLTLAHEFSHVFTATPTELDREADVGDCTTFHNGEGCYLADSILAAWAAEFWPSHLAGFDVEDNREDAVVERCAIDPGFFGSYGATNPEEDFAEAFAAYVLRVPATGPSQQLRLDWIDDQPGLREFRDRATEFGYGPLSSTFDECGFAAAD